LAVNELTIKQRERIVRLVRDGLSFRSIERITGHRRETISRYAREAGDGKRTVTTAPLLDAFERTIVPPEGSTRERAIARPSPVPSRPAQRHRARNARRHEDALHR